MTVSMPCLRLLSRESGQIAFLYVLVVTLKKDIVKIVLAFHKLP